MADLQGTQGSQLPPPRPSPGLIPQLCLTSWPPAGEGELTRMGSTIREAEGAPTVSFHPNNNKSPSSGATPNLPGRVPQHSHSLSGLHLPLSNQPWVCQLLAALCLPKPCGLLNIPPDSSELPSLLCDGKKPPPRPTPGDAVIVLQTAAGRQRSLSPALGEMK